jgi:hypothetical protein
MRIERDRPRKGDMTQEAIEQIWVGLGKEPPGPLQTVRGAREARKRANAKASAR